MAQRGCSCGRDDCEICYSWKLLLAGLTDPAEQQAIIRRLKDEAEFEAVSSADSPK